MNDVEVSLRSKHLLGIEQLSREELLAFLDNADNFSEVMTRDLKKVPALRGKTVINLFLEPSTRTRSSFEIAAKILSADTINISGSESSSTKGETLLDTAQTLEAMNPDVLIIRHKESGAPHLLAKHLKRTVVVNAGDGIHEHPTQAILDCMTIRQHLRPQGRSLSGIKVAIVGDVRHSRVARSTIYAHRLLANEVTLIGPETLVPRELAAQRAFGFKGGVRVASSLREGLEGADVVMCLRMQLERQAGNFVPNLEEYSREYGVSESVLRVCAPQSIVLHPGPANRGIEVSSEVLDGPRSLFRRQVHNGVAARMAVLFLLATHKENQPSKELFAA
ncbi:MAG: aspartate carbamoyltransferase catalytic subunit [Proteobacteria bacterium]|nr:aspartate carbamoyltransferase catalytic subunit [Pseudomonadota bacterium]